MVAAMLAPASAAASSPAVDQYTFNLPDPSGPKHSGSQPVSKPGLLPPQVRQAVSSSPNAALLTQVATASALGAPDTKGSTQGSAGGAGGGQDLSTTGHSIPAVIGDETGSGAALALLGVLAAIAGLGAAALLRNRHIRSRETG